MDFFKTASRISAVLALVLATAAPAAAWTGPSTAPPGGNTPAPVNVSGTVQTKAGYLGVNGGYSTSYPFSVGNAGNSSWNAIFNWPYNTATGYGILVGSSAGGYSQFENGSGYYALLGYGTYGIYTNGNIYASGSVYGANIVRNGGMYTYGTDSYIPNPATGGYSCPSGFSATGPYTSSAESAGYYYAYTYVCR